MGARRRTASWVLLGVVTAALATVAASCGGDDDLGSSLRAIQRLARQEGMLELAISPGHASESLVAPFARQTGCRVTATTATTSQGLVDLVRSGDFDGVSATGTAAALLIASGDVAPIDTELVPGYGELAEGIESLPQQGSEDGPFGVPEGRAPMLLLFREDVLPEPLTSWRAIWERPGRYVGRLTIYDDPMLIALAALYLKTARPELGIDNPYQLDERQFRASVALVRRLDPHVGEYWTRHEADQARSFVAETSLVGMTWPGQVDLVERTGVQVAAVKPDEGTTGWFDTWMISSTAAHPNCMYLWLDYVASARVQAELSEELGHAPFNLTACELTASPEHCAELHADDELWWDDVLYATAPAEDCGDPEGEKTCVGWDEWHAAWTQIRQS